MKAIKPISIWKEGVTTNATKLECYITKDNLIDSATLSWSILSDNTEILGNGVIQISGDDYVQWSDNDYAWNYIATKLGIEFI